MSGNTIQNVLKVSTVEDKKKLFKCFTCDSKFSNPKDLLEHITLDHVSNHPKKYSKAEMLYIRRLEPVSKSSYILFESDPTKTHTHCMLT